MFQRLRLVLLGLILGLTVTGSAQITQPGTTSFTITSQSSTYTAVINDFVLVTSGTFTVNLPASSGNSGKCIRVKNLSTGTITLDGNSTETIDGATTLDMPGIQYQTYTVCSDGTNWVVE